MKHMMAVRDEVGDYIFYIIKDGQASFWYDNWTGEEALYKLVARVYDQTHVANTTFKALTYKPPLQDFV
ncbi:hypothetical protein ACH5RR_001074 [Cinchona calisaya]|uniref:rRNA N-glycosidase n=1 Tax=Cinchona calisaya TaxID=153742 RepID=A0ABD3B359_9GENT